MQLVQDYMKDVIPFGIFSIKNVICRVDILSESRSDEGSLSQLQLLQQQQQELQHLSQLQQQHEEGADESNIQHLNDDEMAGVEVQTPTNANSTHSMSSTHSADTGMCDCLIQETFTFPLVIDKSCFVMDY